MSLKYALEGAGAGAPFGLPGLAAGAGVGLLGQKLGWWGGQQQPNYNPTTGLYSGPGNNIFTGMTPQQIFSWNQLNNPPQMSGTDFSGWTIDPETGQNVPPAPKPSSGSSGGQPQNWMQWGANPYVYPDGGGSMQPQGGPSKFTMMGGGAPNTAWGFANGMFDTADDIYSTPWWRARNPVGLDINQMENPKPKPSGTPFMGNAPFAGNFQNVFFPQGPNPLQGKYF